MPCNYTVFLLRRKESWSAILWSQNFDKMSDRVSSRHKKEIRTILSDTLYCVHHYILLLKYISNHYAFHNK